MGNWIVTTFKKSETYRGFKFDGLSRSDDIILSHEQLREIQAERDIVQEKQKNIHAYL